MMPTPAQMAANEASPLPPRQRLRAWLQLMRPPNLFTVPGDPLAGFLLAGAVTGFEGPAWKLPLAMLSSLLLYIGGLIGNDVADYEEDMRDRPERPLPSGRVPRGHALLVSAAAALTGLVVAGMAGWGTLAMACFAQCGIVLYNGWFKRYAVPGAIVMGLCRGFSLLIGAAAFHPRAWMLPSLVAAAAGLTFYIAGVTWIADRETVAQRIGGRRWVPMAALVAMLAAMAAMGKPLPSVLMLLSLPALAWAFRQGAGLKGVPPPKHLGATIGRLIRGLLLIQAALAASGGTWGGAAAAVGLLTCWPLSRIVAKHFYAT